MYNYYTKNTQMHMQKLQRRPDTKTSHTENPSDNHHKRLLSAPYRTGDALFHCVDGVRPEVAELHQQRVVAGFTVAEQLQTGTLRPPGRVTGVSRPHGASEGHVKTSGGRCMV